jgi:hypothetical protein
MGREKVGKDFICMVFLLDFNELSRSSQGTEERKLSEGWRYTQVHVHTHAHISIQRY